MAVQADSLWPDKAAQPVPLGPAQEAFPTSRAGSYSAFPAEILARLRTELVQYADAPTQQEPPQLKQDDE
ncbi:hypothetical protein [Roseinatronobacter sp.]